MWVTDHVEGFYVVRDDLYTGGTKARALPHVLEALEAREFVYPSPAYGYAQVALAAACSSLRLKATVFVAKRKKFHERTQEAFDLGANVVEVPYGYLSVVKKRARDYAQEKDGAVLLPWGLDFPLYHEQFRLVLADYQPPVTPKEVWCVAGSGVLARTLRWRFPEARLCAVRTGARTELPFVDAVYDAPEAYERPAKVPPPFPSCSNYDAKAWRFLKEHGQKGALFWNVAR